MGQLIIVPGAGASIASAISDDVIAWYKFEETADLAVAIDSKLNFDGVTAATHNELPSRTTGYLGNGLVVARDAASNFYANMLLDEIPSTQKFTIEFRLKLTEEITRGEHATYTLFSKQWASGMKLYSYLVARLESVYLKLVLCYVNSDAAAPAVQVTGCELDSMEANGLYYKNSAVKYTHSVRPEWTIVYNSDESRWEIRNDATVHFYKANPITGTFTTSEDGSGTAVGTGVIERTEEVEINVGDLAADVWHQVFFQLELLDDYLSRFGVWFDAESDIAETEFVVDIPRNAGILPELLGGDSTNFTMAKNDNTIPYIVDGYPFPSSHRYGLDAVVDELIVYRQLRKPFTGTHSRPTLTVTVEGLGAVTVDPAKADYDHLESVELTAVPDGGQSFIGWHGDLSGTDNPETIIMTPGNKSVVAEFSGKVATPSISPAAGTYGADQSITLACLTAGAAIYYTTNGAEPTEGDTLYTAPFTVSVSTTVKAKAFLAPSDPSDVATAAYVLKVATPVFDPVAGSYSGNVEVTITCATSGAAIYFTTDGSEPDAGDTEYTIPIEITVDTTLKAKAFKTDWTSSEVKSGDYLVAEWVRKSDFGGVSRIGPASFSIGGKVYLGTGYNDTYGVGSQKDLWEYDPATNAWTQKADLPGVARYYAVGFAIGTKGYIGTGHKPETGTMLRDFYEYNPATNTWSTKTNFGGTARYGCAGVATATKGYVGLGNSGASFPKDFWEYDPGTNAWVEKTEFPGEGRSSSSAFQVGNKVYLGLGNGMVDGSTTYFSDFWEYDPGTDAWAEKATFGDTRNAAAAASGTSFGYVLGGNRMDSISPPHFTIMGDVWKYDTTIDTWTQESDFDGAARYVGTAVVATGVIYFGCGLSTVYLKDFWARAE